MRTLLTAVALPAAFVLAGLVAGLIVRRLLLARLLRVAAATGSVVDDLVVRALAGPVVLWGVVLGLYLAAVVATMPPGLDRIVQRALLVLVIFSMTWTVARLAAAAVARSAAATGGLLPAASLISHLVRLAVLAIGLLVILQTLGISITPIITALGVGGLAVALALQDTLANLFAGIHILATRQIRPGDFVRLESGEEGYVQDVTWRNTTIRQLPNNVTIVPNARLAGSITTNYYLPTEELAVLVPVGVSYASDLERVERVAIEIGRDVMREVPGGVPDFEPFIRYNAFADSSVNFTVILRGREFVDQHIIRHEYIKRLHARFHREGIEIPFPQRTVHLRAEETPSASRALTPATSSRR